MNGFIRKAAAVLCCAAGVGGLGCYTYHDLVDPCYPERYNFQARKEVVASYSPQIQNGHVLDQTVWNYDFEAGTDRLTGGGLEHLAYMARRRPQPDTTVYLQTAQDVAYDPANTDELGQKRQDIDAKRVVAIQKFLNAQTGGRRGEFQVLIHDPSEVGVSGEWATGENSQLRIQSLGAPYQPGGGGVSTPGTGAAAIGAAAGAGAAAGSAAASGPQQ
jgi:hypothetical protein